jgi:membrane protease YdiL (CAAX protease family)
LIVGFFLLFSVLLGVFMASAEVGLGESDLDPQGVLAQWLTLSSALIATFVFLRLVEKLPWSTIGLHAEAASPTKLARGTALGAGAIGVAALMLVAVQQLRIVAAPDGSWWGTAGHAAAVLLPAAFFEEVLMRGYVFSVLRRTAGWKVALVFTSVVFGLLHAGNPGADAQSMLAVIVAGFFLGAVFLEMRSLYAVGAAHFAWNWTMAGLFHTPVSGLAMPTPDYRTVDSGPDWLTGGAWGPESGFVAIAIMFAGLVYLFQRNLRRMEPYA